MKGYVTKLYSTLAYRYFTISAHYTRYTFAPTSERKDYLFLHPSISLTSLQALELMSLFGTESAPA